MEGFELATIFVAPSAFQNFCERDPRTLVGVFGVLIEVATGPCKNGGIRAGGHFRAPPLIFKTFSGWPRDTVEMQGFELAAIFVPTSDFQNFFEVATGPCKNAGNLAGGHLLSSLFSLLSAFFRPA